MGGPLIGTKGTRIRNIQTESGVEELVVKNNSNREPGVQIKGIPETVVRALELIEEATSNKKPNGRYSVKNFKQPTEKEPTNLITANVPPKQSTYPSSVRVASKAAAPNSVDAGAWDAQV